MSITRFQPLGDFVSLRDAMDRLFEDSFIRPSQWVNGNGVFAVPVDLWETAEAYHLRADVPGLTPDDLDINATQDTITISGEVKADAPGENDAWLRRERRYGKFTRSFTLPLQIDANKIDATFENGTLHLVMPKADEVRPKQIKVRATTK